MGAAIILHCQVGAPRSTARGARPCCTARSSTPRRSFATSPTSKELTNRAMVTRSPTTYCVSDGSYPCQCRTFQTLGLANRARHQHTSGRLASSRRGKMGAADRHARPDGETGGFEGAPPDQGAAPDSTRDGKWKTFTGTSQALQTVFLQLVPKGPTLRDQHVLYEDVSKTQRTK